MTVSNNKQQTREQSALSSKSPRVFSSTKKYNQGWNELRVRIAERQSIGGLMNSGKIICKDTDGPEPKIERQYLKVERPEPSTAHKLVDAVESLLAPKLTRRTREDCNGCGDDHAPADCMTGFNSPEL